MRTAKLLSTSDLSLPADSYIYALRPTRGALAALSSDDSIRIFDPKTLQLLPDGIISKVHESVTCLKVWDDNVLATAGRDSAVRFWDRRTRKAVIEFKAPKPFPLSALELSSLHHTLIAGVELDANPPGDAPIFIWDTRVAGSGPRLSLLESHTDTITELALHPSAGGGGAALLLSGSTDGLVNVFDLRQSEEEDALRQVVNHGSAVHRAGFLRPPAGLGREEGDDMFVFGTDETVAFYRCQDSGDDDDGGAGEEGEEEVAPVRIGDVRERLACEYLVGVYPVGGGSVVAAGNHSSQYLDLLALHDPPAGQPLNYSCTPDDCLRLPSAHGEEIVRDLYFDPDSSTIFTCGEDGKVRAWAGYEDTSAEPPTRDAAEKKQKEKRKEKKHKEKGKERYKPY